MEMAAKDNIEGRYLTCCSTYDKIVGMAVNCERLVAEINSEWKQKPQKAKPNVFERRMHLSNVGVIKRNPVYIIGLPLDLADEVLHQRREYFGHYGKVLKVSISKQQMMIFSIHQTIGVAFRYVTYSKEEEAVCCIQSVHSFVLDGRSLGACFGTTKYCHAWLRNVPCSIPDYLYLHDYVSQEDSFSKYEIVSAFSRAILSDEEEKTCPLCAEEMDLADQQLKPYKICVWCWHHIIEMAPKDNIEGHYPTCCSTYDKIVGMVVNCERLVAKINSEWKRKPQKAKPNVFEGRMHLSNVGVIKRNLVYIIGLPLDLADEDLHQQREYFGQYGKVLKVSISKQKMVLFSIHQTIGVAYM